METAPTNVSFKDLSALCEHYFGKARSKGGKAKPYQVRQVLAAIAKLEAESET